MRNPVIRIEVEAENGLRNKTLLVHIGQNFLHFFKRVIDATDTPSELILSTVGIGGLLKGLIFYR